MNATKDHDDDGEMIAATIETVTAPAVITTTVRVNDSDLDVHGAVEDALRPADVKLLETDPQAYVGKTYRPFKW